MYVVKLFFCFCFSFFLCVEFWDNLQQGYGWYGVLGGDSGIFISYFLTGTYVVEDCPGFFLSSLLILTP